MPRVMMLIMALLVGAGLTLQAGTNAQLRNVLGSPFRAGLVNFTVGGILLAVMSLITVSEPMTLRQNAWWMWIGGLFGAAFVLGSVMLAPRLGATTLFAGIVAGQLIMALIVDQFGLVGYRPLPLTWPRALGVLLLIGGLLLIQRR